MSTAYIIAIIQVIPSGFKCSQFPPFGDVIGNNPFSITSPSFQIHLCSLLWNCWWVNARKWRVKIARMKQLPTKQVEIPIVSELSESRYPQSNLQSPKEINCFWRHEIASYKLPVLIFSGFLLPILQLSISLSRVNNGIEQAVGYTYNNLSFHQVNDQPYMYKFSDERS